MLKVHVFGPKFGMPDASPFCMKALVLLKMSGLPFEVDSKGFGKSPKGKQPYLNDNGQLIADSSFIRWHLEDKHGIQFDTGLSAAERGTAWAFEKLCEDNLYFIVMRTRWMDDRNFEAGPRHTFDDAPAPLRPLIAMLVRGKMRKALQMQGMGRHTEPEMMRIAQTGIDAIAAQLGDKPWLMGQQPCSADAMVFSSITSLLSPHFVSALREATSRHANLVAYSARGLQRWFPEMAG